MLITSCLTDMAFIYGILYLFLTFYPIVFQQIHGLNPGVGSLPYLGIIMGEVCYTCEQRRSWIIAHVLIMCCRYVRASILS